MTDRLFVMGAGRAGKGLARALRASGVEIVGMHGTRVDAEQGITAGQFPPGIGQASIVLVTVRDAQLDGALRELLEARLAASAVVLHASGAAHPGAIDELRSTGRAVGTFHPLVPLANPERAAEVLRNAWIGIDGDGAAVAAGERLAARLSAHTLRIPPGTKARYHAAAVFASNFPTVLAALAHRLLKSAGVSEKESWDAVLHLMVASVSNIHANRPVDALTGPIVRGDVDTVVTHVHALRDDAEAIAIYRALSSAAVEMAKDVGTDLQLLQRIADVIDAR